MLKERQVPSAFLDEPAPDAVGQVPILVSSQGEVLAGTMDDDLIPAVRFPGAFAGNSDHGNLDRVVGLIGRFAPGPTSPYSPPTSTDVAVVR